jgi:hypothetical protein
MLTAGAARFDQYDEPLTDLDELAGRGATDDKSVFYGGPLRAKMELLQIQPLDRVEMGGQQGQNWRYDVFATREVFAKGKGAEVLGSYKDGSPAVIRRKANKGVVFTTGTLPGQAYVRRGLMPARPMGKGGPEWNFSQIEPMEFDDLAAKVILLPVEGLTPEAKADHRGVVTNVLESKNATLIPVVNLAKLADGKLKDVTIAVPGLRGAKNVRTAMKQEASVEGKGDQTTIELRELDEADVIVIEH